MNSKKEDKSFVQEKSNVLDIISKAIKAIKKEDIIALKDLSDRTIHSASIYQDSDSITVAVLIYALSKVFERSKYKEYVDWSLFSEHCIESLVKAKKDLKKGNTTEFREDLRSIREVIDHLSSNLKGYIEEVFRKAMINKASRLYEHGISLQKTAELLGITPWELSEYAGTTGIGEVDLSVTLDIKSRIERTLNLFK